MVYTLKQLVSSLREIPANIEGKQINSENLGRVIEALSFEGELNVSPDQLKGFLAGVSFRERSLPKSEKEKLTISLGELPILTATCQRDSDGISYLSLEPSKVVYNYLRQRRVFS